MRRASRAASDRPRHGSCLRGARRRARRRCRRLDARRRRPSSPIAEPRSRRRSADRQLPPPRQSDEPPARVGDHHAAEGAHERGDGLDLVDHALHEVVGRVVIEHVHAATWSWAPVSRDRRQRATIRSSTASRVNAGRMGWTSPSRNSNSGFTPTNRPARPRSPRRARSRSVDRAHRPSRRGGRPRWPAPARSTASRSSPSRAARRRVHRHDPLGAGCGRGVDHAHWDGSSSRLGGREGPPRSSSSCSERS